MAIDMNSLNSRVTTVENSSSRAYARIYIRGTQSYGNPTTFGVRLNTNTSDTISPPSNLNINVQELTGTVGAYTAYYIRVTFPIAGTYRLTISPSTYCTLYNNFVWGWQASSGGQIGELYTIYKNGNASLLLNKSGGFGPLRQTWDQIHHLSGGEETNKRILTPYTVLISMSANDYLDWEKEGYAASDVSATVVIEKV